MVVGMLNGCRVWFIRLDTRIGSQRPGSASPRSNNLLLNSLKYQIVGHVQPFGAEAAWCVCHQLDTQIMVGQTTTESGLMSIMSVTMSCQMIKNIKN